MYFYIQRTGQIAAGSCKTMSAYSPVVCTGTR